MVVEASIVSVGSWNSRIFTPSWVSENVFAMPEGESMNVGLNEQQLTLTYMWKDIQLLITDSRIELKTSRCASDKLVLMEQCYLRMSEMLPYTPVNAVGFNLNLQLSQDEYCKTNVSRLFKLQTLGDYVGDTLTFKATKEGSVRSFVIHQRENGGDIRINFHYPKPKELPPVGTGFEMIASELKVFLGYEFSL